jgi:hypothetical protein
MDITNLEPLGLKLPATRYWASPECSNLSTARRPFKSRRRTVPSPRRPAKRGVVFPFVAAFALGFVATQLERVFKAR